MAPGWKRQRCDVRYLYFWQFLYIFKLLYKENRFSFPGVKRLGRGVA